MPEISDNDGFTALETDLLQAGGAPRHVNRIVSELEDHVIDLRDEALERGMSENDARAFAMRRIGDQGDIAARMVAVPNMRAWIYRYPRVARLYLPVAYALLLPAFPVFAGIANAGMVLRWTAALMLSAGVTASMMLILQLAIAVT